MSQAAELRYRVYRHFAETGQAPTLAEISTWLGSESAALATLQELDDQHLLVLQADRREIRMSLPFSAVETPYRVRYGEFSWWANCAWDALAIPQLLEVDGSIETQWSDNGRPVDLAVRDGELVGETEGFVHYEVPARHWWDDIVET